MTTNDIDVDGIVLPDSLDIVCFPIHGTLVVSIDGIVNYQPDFGYNGADSFSYRVKDNSGAYSNIATVSICIGEFMLGDINQDGSVDLLDVSPFVNLLSTGKFQVEADINQDGLVDLLDVAPFVGLLTGG